MSFTLPIIVPNDVEVVVASFGGVGTTFLMDYIAKYKKTNFSCDRDLLKHSPFPPISYNKQIRYLYIYGDPITATVSLFRRDYHHWQAEKLTRYSAKKTNIFPETSLAEYAAQQVDSFKFREHFYNWYDKYLVHPTMFIRYESIFEHVEEIVEFLGLPNSAITNFPQKKKRQSSLDNLDSDTLDNLQQLYGSFAEELGGLNDIEIRYPKHKNSFSETYFSSPYPRVIFNNLLDVRMLARNNSFNTYKGIKQLKDSIAKK